MGVGVFVGVGVLVGVGVEVGVDVAVAVSVAVAVAVAVAVGVAVASVTVGWMGIEAMGALPLQAVKSSVSANRIKAVGRIVWDMSVS